MPNDFTHIHTFEKLFPNLSYLQRRVFFLRLSDLVLLIFAYKKYGEKIVNDLNVYQGYRPILSSAYSQADTY